MKLPDSRVIEIFNEQKDLLLAGLKPDKEPIAVLLGGQPACGKGSLVVPIKKNFPEKKFLVVNGDMYRVYHPDHLAIGQKDIKHYSDLTQNFSNVFTEKLIDHTPGDYRTGNLPQVRRTGTESRYWTTGRYGFP